MVKNFIKSMLALGMLLLIFQFSLGAIEQAPQMIEFEAYLKPQDLALLEKDEQMVYMPTDFIAVMRDFSSNAQEVKDLNEYVNMGYCIIPRQDVEKAVAIALESCNPESHEYSVIKNYQASILAGEADVLTKEDLGERRIRKCGKFCQLFVRNCASIGNLIVRNNASVCGNLCVGGTVSACNFSFTGSGCTGCTATSTFPNISACGNIVFNTAGTNALNAQGAFARFLRIECGNIVLTSAATPGIVLGSLTGTPNSAITVTGTPTAILNGTSIATTGSGFSSGITIANETDTGAVFEMVINIQIPITFTTNYASAPAILLTTQGVGSFVTNIPLADINSFTELSLGVSIVTVTPSNAVINLIFNIMAQGANIGGAYANALVSAQNAINNILNNGISINFLADGAVV